MFTFYYLRETFIQNKIKLLYNSLSLNDLNAVYPVNTYLNWISSINASQNSPMLITMLKQVDIISNFSTKCSHVWCFVFLKDGCAWKSVWR